MISPPGMSLTRSMTMTEKSRPAKAAGRRAINGCMSASWQGRKARYERAVYHQRAETRTRQARGQAGENDQDESQARCRLSNSELLDMGFVDELRLITYPVVAGGAHSLFGHGETRHKAELVLVRDLGSGLVRSDYRFTS
jgi:hypothetical protein